MKKVSTLFGLQFLRKAIVKILYSQSNDFILYIVYLKLQGCKFDSLCMLDLIHF